MENADDVFVIIEEVEIQENENIVNRNNNQTENKIDLNKPLETEDILNEVKKNLYNSMCYYWECTTDDNLLSTILDPRVKSMRNKVEEEELLHKYYEEYQVDYLLTPIESHTASLTSSEVSTIYKPKLFQSFEQNQPKASDEVKEYIKEDEIPLNNAHLIGD